jgi:hypothetical protein
MSWSHVLADLATSARYQAAVDDAAAASVAVESVYRNGSVLMERIA